VFSENSSEKTHEHLGSEVYFGFSLLFHFVPKQIGAYAYNKSLRDYVYDDEKQDPEEVDGNDQQFSWKDWTSSDNPFFTRDCSGYDVVIFALLVEH
jgi:hypothetical protein